MKVLHVIPAVAPRYGGPSRAVLDMCRGLLAEGVDVLLVTTDADGPGRLQVTPGATVAYEGTPTRFFPRQVSESFKFSMPLSRWLHRHASGFDAVHIHAVYSHSSLAAARACRRHGVPYVLRPLGSLDPWSLSQKAIRKRVLWHLGVRLMLQRAAAIHYTTAAEQRLAEQRVGPTKGVVIPLGVDPGALAAGPTALAGFRTRHPALGERPYVLVLSRLHPKKQIALFLDAFLDVTRRDGLDRWRLVVAGDGDPSYVSTLRRRVAERGGGRVLFTGWLDGADKQAALSGASLLALPSRQENFGLAVLEALAVGVPVLVSTHVNLADEIERAKAGWVVPLEHDAMTAALRTALRDEAERAARGRAARACAALYAWPAITRQLRSLYASLRTDMQDGGAPAARVAGGKSLAQA